MNPTIAFISLPPSLGGSIRALETHLDAMRDVRCVLAGPARSSAIDYLMATERFDEIVDVTAHGRGRLASMAMSALRFRSWARAQGDSLVAIHANGMPEMTVAFPAAAATGVPLVVWAHGVDVPRWVTRFSSVWKRGSVDVRWAAVSRAAADKILATGVARPDDMHIVPNPIDPAVALADRVPSDGPVRLAFLGGGSVRKGFDLMPGMLTALADRDVRLYTAGAPPKSGDANWAAVLEHGSRVHQLGALSDVREIYRVSDIVLMPSRQESFGRVAAEAMMNGLPLVAFDIPALREVIGAGEGGVLVPLDDADRFTEAVRQLVDDRDLRTKLGTIGRERAKAYLPSSVSADLRGLYGLETTDAA